MPSLHIGWSTWVTFALFPVLRSWWGRAIVVLYPFVMLTAVVVTGNHYILDGAGGVGAMVLGLLLAWAVDRLRDRRYGATRAPTA
jgi:membrane-associated phospholipid phosphatase